MDYTDYAVNYGVDDTHIMMHTRRFKTQRGARNFARTINMAHYPAWEICRQTFSGDTGYMTLNARVTADTPALRDETEYRRLMAAWQRTQNA